MSERFMGLHTIYGAEGEHETPYMTRAWIGRLRLHIFYRGDADPDCHDHPWDFWTFPLTPYVEEVAEQAAHCEICPEPDGVPCFCDLACDLPTNGITRRFRIVRAFRLHYRPAGHTHRVLGRYAGNGFDPDYAQYAEPIILGGRMITIVWRGRTERSWGFLKNREGQWCWVPWRQYVFGAGKHAPCEPTHNEENAHADL